MTQSKFQLKNDTAGNILLVPGVGYYRWCEPWAAIPGSLTGEHSGKTHGIAISNAGYVIVFYQAIPSVLVYDCRGQLVNSWGTYPGAHGLTRIEEDGEEFVWLTDERNRVVEKLTLDGRLIQSLTQPDHPLYRERPYRPTWVAVNEVGKGGTGDIWVADGYGAHLVHRFEATGQYLQTVDGGEGAGRFDCPHGIWFDCRKRPMDLYVADRGNKRVAVYDAEGRFKRSFGTSFLTSPDGFANLGNLLVVPELMGRVTVLDEQDNLVEHFGGNADICTKPSWPDMTPIELGKFSSPHAAAVDALGNIFVVEWRVGGRIIKLEKLHQR